MEIDWSEIFECLNNLFLGSVFENIIFFNNIFVKDFLIIFRVDGLFFFWGVNEK